MEIKDIKDHDNGESEVVFEFSDEEIEVLQRAAKENNMTIEECVKKIIEYAVEEGSKNTEAPLTDEQK